MERLVDLTRRVQVFSMTWMSVANELAAFREATDLCPEAVWPMRLPLADALHFWKRIWVRVDVDLAFARAENLNGRWKSSDRNRCVADIVDDAAQIGLEPRTLSGGAPELKGMRLAWLLDQRQLAELRIGLAKLDGKMCARRTKRSRARFSSLASVRKYHRTAPSYRRPRAKSLCSNASVRIDKLLSLRAVPRVSVAATVSATSAQTAIDVERTLRQNN